MCFFISLFPATFWLVIGYIVYFLSTKSDGRAQKFGRILAIWIFMIAAFIPVMGLIATLSGHCPITGIMDKMQTM
ncbi:MAG: hypothetical protein H6936_06220 [Burkholderiales bacterium]|nr:hypothetical protein [Nitrosomonas sp.]MCP5274439.1 hypothetical protein [Burkholderiales bacterium]